MAFQFPWTNFHELNLDWFLSKFKQFTDNYLGTTATVELIPDTEQPEVTVTGGTLDDDTDIVDPFTFNFKLPVSQSGGAVDSVNGQTGAVVLDKSDIGLGNVDNVQQYSSTNPPPYPVTSVNGDTGAVVLDKTDIGLGNVANVAQYSASNPPPYPVTSVNGQTGAVTVTPASDAQVTTAVNTWLGNNVAQETGYVLDRSLTMSNAGAPADLVGDLKNSLSDAQSRLINLDGIIAFPQTEIGLVYVNNGQIAFANSNNVIRTIDSVALKEGDELISANTGFKFLVSYSSDGTSYLSSGWKGDTNYKAPVDGIYYFSLAKNPNVVITETVYNEILNNFSLYRESANTVDLVQNIVESQKVNVSFYDGYYTANGIPVQSTENGVKYTSKISTFYGLTLDISISLASDNNLWVAVGEWKKDGTFERTTLFSGRRASWTGKRIISQDVEEISIMFYGHNSFTFSVSALSNSVSIIDACAGMVNDIYGENINKSYAFSSHTVKGINHRGYNSVAPENTMPAFKLSVENGFSFVETDVRFTSDNVPVLLHDATVDRTSNGTGNISNMTFAQARELDFGSWKSVTYAGTKIPSLEEFIIFCRNVKIFPYLEISATYTDEQFNIMYDIVNKNGMSNAVTWISFNPSNLSKILTHDQTARVCRIQGNTLTEEIATSADGLKTGANEVFVSVDYNYIDNNTVTICKNHSLPLETWTINTAELIAGLPSYVSGGTSDLVNFETIVREQALN